MEPTGWSWEAGARGRFASLPLKKLWLRVTQPGPAAPRPRPAPPPATPGPRPCTRPRSPAGLRGEAGVRDRRVRRLHRLAGRRAGEHVRDAGGSGRRQVDYDDRIDRAAPGAGLEADRRARPVAAG